MPRRFYASVEVVSAMGYTLAVREEGAGPPVLFLHALAASSRYWAGRLGDLPQTHRCIMPDLLGFARSPKPRLAYTVGDHLDALDGTLRARGDLREPLMLVGHSLGAILAVEFAARHPERVRGLVLFGLPRFHDEDEARTFIAAHGGRFARMSVRRRKEGWGSNLGYYLSLPLLPLIERVAVRVVRDMPPEVVVDSLHNTQRSYGGTLLHCILDHDLTPALDTLRDLPIHALHGDHDPAAPLDNVRELAARMPNVRLEVLAGKHHLFLEQHAAALAALSRSLKPAR